MSQWYEGLVVVSIGLLLISVMTSCLCVLYTEGLDEKACVKFVCDHFSYFGEPLAMMLVALYNAMVATIIWIFGAYGLGVGIVTLVVRARPRPASSCRRGRCLFAADGCSWRPQVFFYTILRTTVIYLYLGKWENKDLSEVEIENRKNLAKAIANSTGSTKENITEEGGSTSKKKVGSA